MTGVCALQRTAKELERLEAVLQVHQAAAESAELMAPVARRKVRKEIEKVGHLAFTCCFWFLLEEVWQICGSLDGGLPAKHFMLCLIEIMQMVMAAYNRSSDEFSQGRTLWAGFCSLFCCHLAGLQMRCWCLCEAGRAGDCQRQIWCARGDPQAGALTGQ